MRKFVGAVCMLLLVCSARSQSKVFKQVGDEISSTMKVITQDDALVGYLVFTKLEKASEDSFNYKISIMDENLNDIGTVNFREENLTLQAVSFDQDVLCLGYLKSSLIDKVMKNRKTYNAEAERAKHAVVVQFLGLDGKQIKLSQVRVEPKTEMWGNLDGTKESHVSLKEPIQLKNIPQRGFACFYGDENGNKLLAYNLSGEQMWKKNISSAKGFAMLTSGTNIYLLSKQQTDMIEGGYQVNGYGFADSVTFDKCPLRDKQGNQLKVLSFTNDPVTGNPVITGNIINADRAGKVVTIRNVTQGPYSGVYTIALNGPKKADWEQTFTYWNDGSLEPAISERGRYTDNNAYCRFSSAFRDFQGNTYFVGTPVTKRIKWGSIASSVILAPMVFVSPFILASGVEKFKLENAMLLKQNNKGALSFDNTIPCNSTKFAVGRVPLSELYSKSFYNINNAANKSNFLIVDDEKDIVIYNVNNKKVVRTVPHQAGKVSTNIFPAKEGYVMVQEYNKRDKYMKLSIEAL